ncbi:MAG: MATE family efflux transporter [Ruminococcaceae bacterium]|nr:MATE family efflux transporter [Oscillospiraceae bacterium]
MCYIRVEAFSPHRFYQWEIFMNSFFYRNERNAGIREVTLLSLTLPLIFENIMNRLLGTVNTAVLGAYSDASVAAVGSANTVVNVLLVFFSVVSAGAAVIISNHIGAKNEQFTKESCYTSITLSLVIAAILTPVLLILSPTLIGMMNLEGRVFDEALVYLRIRIAFIVCTVLTNMLLSVLRCFGYPKYTFFIGILTNVINLALCILVVYFPDYSPIHGVAGIGVASVTATTTGLLFIVFIFRRLRLSPQRPQSRRDFAAHSKSILRIGIPSGISGLSYNLSSMLTMSFVALLGDVAVSAKVYYTDILSYVYLIGISMGSANSIIVGRLFGAGEYDAASKQNARVVRFTVPINLCASLLVLIFRTPLLSLFTSDKTIIAMSLGVFAVDIITEQARAWSHVYEYALRATGDVYFTTACITLSCAVFGIGLAYLLSIPLGLGLLGCFIGLAADETTRALATFFRWKSNKWRSSAIQTK